MSLELKEECDDDINKEINLHLYLNLISKVHFLCFSKLLCFIL